jgi:hypothetical protein
MLDGELPSVLPPNLRELDLGGNQYQGAPIPRCQPFMLFWRSIWGFAVSSWLAQRPSPTMGGLGMPSQSCRASLCRPASLHGRLTKCSGKKLATRLATRFFQFAFWLATSGQPLCKSQYYKAFSSLWCLAAPSPSISCTLWRVVHAGGGNRWVGEGRGVASL